MKHFANPFLVAAALCVATLLPARAEMDVIRLTAAIEASLEADYPKLDALYKEIHAHPELAFEEVKTAARLAAEMRALGFEVTEKVGKTGLVAIYQNGDGPTIMVRTELDALPMEEKTGLAYASRDKVVWGPRETFVAHSCGHDIHMASWVGTAKTLLGLKDQWRGTLMFIAQPAEETVSGAKAMLDDGLFTRFKKPDAAFALHDGPFPHGQLRYRTGIGSSISDGLFIKFRGRGGHGATPQSTIDPVVIASRFIVEVAKCDQPRKGSDRVRRGQRRRNSCRHRREHHSGRCPGDRHHPQLQAGGAGKAVGGDRAHGEGGGRDVGCARAGDQDHRRHQIGDQRCCGGWTGREGAEGGVRRQGQDVAAGHAERGFSEFAAAGCRR